LVFTTLTKEALPVIRYRTRDLTSLLPPTARSMRRMAKITGRSDDMLIIRGVNVFPSQIEELMLKRQGLAPHYLLEVSRDAIWTALSVQVECTEGLSPVTWHAQSDHYRVAAGYQGCDRHFRASGRVQKPGTLERSAGKATRVVDKRNLT
jgi:phenylacetate-CoA ligase